MTETFKEKWIKDYLEWLTIDIWYKAIDNPDDAYSYQKLFRQMLETKFRWSHTEENDLYMDENRAGDGIHLRAQYCNENWKAMEDPSNLDDFCTILPTGNDCSVLEMIVAFSKRIDEEVMYDSSCGDRSGIWCYRMFENLRLLRYDDDHYSKSAVSRILSKFMNRKYDWNGRGGLFYIPLSEEQIQSYFEWIPNYKLDMTNTELWQQMGIWTQLYDAGFIS